MQSKQYKVLLDEMRDGFREINNQLASFDRDLTKDRQDLGDFNVRLATVERELTEVRKALNLSADRTQDKVEDTINPLRASVNKLTTQIRQKKMVVLKEPEVKLPSTKRVIRFMVTMLATATIGAFGVFIYYYWKK